MAGVMPPAIRTCALKKKRRERYAENWYFTFDVSLPGDRELAISL